MPCIQLNGLTFSYTFKIDCLACLVIILCICHLTIWIIVLNSPRLLFYIGDREQYLFNLCYKQKFIQCANLLFKFLSRFFGTPFMLLIIMFTVAKKIFN